LDIPVYYMEADLAEAAKIAKTAYSELTKKGRTESQIKNGILSEIREKGLLQKKYWFIDNASCVDYNEALWPFYIAGNASCGYIFYDSPFINMEKAGITVCSSDIKNVEITKIIKKKVKELKSNKFTMTMSGGRTADMYISQMVFMKDFNTYFVPMFYYKADPYYADCYCKWTAAIITPIDDIFKDDAIKDNGQIFPLLNQVLTNSFMMAVENKWEAKSYGQNPIPIPNPAYYPYDDGELGNTKEYHYWYMFNSERTDIWVGPKEQMRQLAVADKKDGIGITKNIEFKIGGHVKKVNILDVIVPKADVIQKYIKVGIASGVGGEGKKENDPALKEKVMQMIAMGVRWGYSPDEL